jgi:hypothetical protein
LKVHDERGEIDVAIEYLYIFRPAEIGLILPILEAYHEQNRHHGFRFHFWSFGWVVKF